MSNMSLQMSPDIENQEIPDCVHYWIIDVPSGPVSKGKCRMCGERKEFRNYLETASAWDDDRTPSQVSTSVSSSLSPLGGLWVEWEKEED